MTDQSPGPFLGSAPAADCAGCHAELKRLADERDAAIAEEARQRECADRWAAKTQALINEQAVTARATEAELAAARAAHEAMGAEAAVLRRALEVCVNELECADDHRRNACPKNLGRAALAQTASRAYAARVAALEVALASLRECAPRMGNDEVWCRAIDALAKLDALTAEVTR